MSRTKPPKQRRRRRTRARNQDGSQRPRRSSDGRHEGEPASLAKRMRSGSVTVGLTVLVAAALTRCGGPDNQAICVDPATQVRVDDDECDEDGSDYSSGYHSGRYYWYYLRDGTRAPAVGSAYTSTPGTFDRAQLSGSVRKGGISSEGGIVRGGWGGFHAGS